MIRRAVASVVVVAAVAGIVPVVGAPAEGIAAGLSIGRVHERFDPSKGKIFVLVIGNDARAGNPDTARADAIHILGINTKTMKGGILNFPRDSWVGGRRINEYSYGIGPAGLARTIESLTGIRLDYWMMTGFEGFRDIVNAVGPVPIHIPTDVYDPIGSGARIEAGHRKLSGGSALAYARTRKIFSGGDITRTTNQARLLIALLRKLRLDVERNPARLLRWVAVGRDNTRINIPPRELFRLAILATQVKPKDIGNVTLPVTLGSVGAASVVFISGGASSIYRRFARTASL